MRCHLRDPLHQKTFGPAGSNEEIELSLVPRRWSVSKEGTSFHVKCGCESEDSRTIEKPVVWKRLEEDGFGHTRDVCVECRTVLNGGDRLIRSMKEEQTHRH